MHLREIAEQNASDYKSQMKVYLLSTMQHKYELCFKIIKFLRFYVLENVSFF